MNEIVGLLFISLSIYLYIAYLQYLSSNLDEYDVPEETPNALEKGDVYEDSSNGKFFLSIDLKSANFNSLRFCNPALILGCNSWEDLIGKFTNLTYFLK